MVMLGLQKALVVIWVDFLQRVLVLHNKLRVERAGRGGEEDVWGRGGQLSVGLRYGIWGGRCWGGEGGWVVFNPCKNCVLS